MFFTFKVGPFFFTHKYSFFSTHFQSFQEDFCKKLECFGEGDRERLLKITLDNEVWFFNNYYFLFLTTVLFLASY